MKFTLKIDLDNAHFVDDVGDLDVGDLYVENPTRAIRNVSTLIWNRGIARDSIGYVQDGNGNTVGQWKIK